MHNSCKFLKKSIVYKMINFTKSNHLNGYKDILSCLNTHKTVYSNYCTSVIFTKKGILSSITVSTPNPTDNGAHNSIKQFSMVTKYILMQISLLG